MRAKRSIVVALALGLAACASAPEPATTVRTTSGWVAGVQNGGAVAFKGLPYSAPPVGPLRWKPPRPVKRWEGVRAADAFGPACLQPVNADGSANLAGVNGPASEDCLTLNVWAPPSARRAPVMVWLHGGGHRFGSGAVATYDGTAFARDGVVLVTVNYRLAGLGYFAHPAISSETREEPTGNFGLMDQIAALKWVQANIAAFGGDSGNVTVFGQSSGGMDVLALMTTPAARGLFHRAIVQSGGGWVQPSTLSEREAQGVAYVKALGVPDGSSPEELRAIPPESFLDPTFTLDFQPFVDGRLIAETSTQAFAAGRAAPIPLMIGSNSFEGSLTAPGADALRGADAQVIAIYERETDDPTLRRQLAYGDRYQGAPSRWVAAQASKAAPVFLYRFDYVPENRRAGSRGAGHGSETPFVFDTLDTLGVANVTERDKAAAKKMHDCWVSFARAGRPQCETDWPTYSASDVLLEFGDEIAPRPNVRMGAYDAWERTNERLWKPEPGGSGGE